MPCDDVTRSSCICHRRVRRRRLACPHVLLDLLFPRRCFICTAPGATLCPACVHSLPRIAAPVCDRCGAPSAWPVARCRECAGRRIAFASARAAVEYDARVRTLVSGWKERGLRDLASQAAGVVAEVLAMPG